jgi:hypothetical protein
MPSASALLLELACGAIDDAQGNAFKAKLNLSRVIQETPKIGLLREIYGPWHNAAIERAIQSGFKSHRAAGRYSIAKGAGKPNGRAHYHHDANGHTPHVEDAPTAESAFGIPFMITENMRHDLRAAGCTDRDPRDAAG